MGRGCEKVEGRPPVESAAREGNAQTRARPPGCGDEDGDRARSDHQMRLKHAHPNSHRERERHTHSRLRESRIKKGYVYSVCM